MANGILTPQEDELIKALSSGKVSNQDIQRLSRGNPPVQQVLPKKIVDNSINKDTTVRELLSRAFDNLKDQFQTNNTVDILKDRAGERKLPSAVARDLSPTKQLPQQGSGIISGPLSKQIQDNLALQSAQQAKDAVAIEESKPVVANNIATEASQAVQEGTVKPQQVGQMAAKLAEGQGATRPEQQAAANKASKDFKLFGMDGKTALLTSLGVGLAGLAVTQDPRGAAAGLPQAINEFNRPERERKALEAATALQERKLGQTDRELDIKENIGLQRLDALRNKIGSGSAIKPSDRPTISEAAATKAVDTFLEENLSDLDVSDDIKADISIQLRERAKTEGGSSSEILQKIILEQFDPVTDPGIFFDDTILTRK